MHKPLHKTRDLQTAKQVADALGMSISQVARYGKRLGVAKLPGRTGSYLFTPAEVAQVRELRRAGDRR